MSAMILLLGLTAAAQERSTVDVFLGYSYIRANPQTSGAPSFNVNGGTASLAINPKDRFGLVADFGGYRAGKVNGVSLDTTLTTYMFCPRFYLTGHNRVTPFIHGLFGGAHSTGDAVGVTGSRNAFAMAVGGGLDVMASKHVSLRAGQVDYLLTQFREVAGGDRKAQNNLRFSTGVRFRF